MQATWTKDFNSVSSNCHIALYAQSGSQYNFCSVARTRKNHLDPMVLLQVEEALVLMPCGFKISSIHWCVMLLNKQPFVSVTTGLLLALTSHFWCSFSLTVSLELFLKLREKNGGERLWGGGNDVSLKELRPIIQRMEEQNWAEWVTQVICVCLDDNIQ